MWNAKYNSERTSTIDSSVNVGFAMARYIYIRSHFYRELGPRIIICYKSFVTDKLIRDRAYIATSFRDKRLAHVTQVGQSCGVPVHFCTEMFCDFGTR